MTKTKQTNQKKPLDGSFCRRKKAILRWKYVPEKGPALYTWILGLPVFKHKQCFIQKTNGTGKTHPRPTATAKLQQQPRCHLGRITAPLHAVWGDTNWSNHPLKSKKSGPDKGVLKAYHSPIDPTEKRRSCNYFLCRALSHRHCTKYESSKGLH